MLTKVHVTNNCKCDTQSSESYIHVKSNWLESILESWSSKYKLQRQCIALLAVFFFQPVFYKSNTYHNQIHPYGHNSSSVHHISSPEGCRAGWNIATQLGGSVNHPGI